MELSFFERKEMVENQLKTRYTIKSQRKRCKNMKKILEDIKTNTYERFYLFYGEEKYMISQMKNQLKKALVSEDDTMNYSYFEGKKADSVEIAELAKTLPFFSDHRFIILDETGLGKKSDDSFIDALKEASQSGVKIKMIIRGICCILPGIEGKTDNIEVISVVGRFLEHSRIFCFGTGENMKMYIASADWMTRNTENRIYDTLRIMWKDNLKARILCSDGTYKKPEIKEGDELIDCQNYLRHEYKVGRKIKL